MFNSVDTNFNAIIKRSNMIGRIRREIECLTFNHRLSGLGMSTKVFESICSPALVVVLRSAVPAGKDLAIAKQLEEILRVGWVRSLNGIVEPNLSARIRWNIARSD